MGETRPLSETRPRSGILVAVDGSETSRRSLDWAAREAASRGVALTIVHCYYWPSSGLGAMDAIGFLMEGLAKDSVEILSASEVAARTVAPDIEIHVESHLGAPVATIVDLSARFEVTVIGSRGMGGFKGMLLGSVSLGVTSNALSSVVVVRGHDDNDSGFGPAGLAADTPIVVGVDPSPAGQLALAEAFAIADRRSCPLVAVHAWVGPGSRLTTEQAAEFQQSVAADLQAQLAPLVARYPGVAVEPVTYRDRATAALLARAQSAQLLVVGTRGRSEIKGMLLGSTSRALVQHSPCPVMVVR